MEEILASIRRIISEEAEAPQAETLDQAGRAESAGDADVLQLTRMVNEDGTVVNLAEQKAMRAETEAEPEPEPQPEPEPETMPAPPPQPMMAPPPPPPAPPEPPEPAPVAARPAPEQPPPPAPEPEEELELQAVEAPAAAEGPVNERPEESLVSKEAEELSTAALAALAQAVAREKIGFSGRTLEDLTKEILRPLLKEWLNENLPGLIERLVRAEIEKMVGHVRDR